MTKITALFFDVGGVLLSNGWDRSTRRVAAQKFGLNWDELEERHELVVSDFEGGRMRLDEYLDRIVFHAPRPFSRDELKNFVLAQSDPYPESLALAAELAGRGKYLLATLNNESLELNQYRIERFGLRNCFTAFFSSCFLGVRKPEEKIFRLALEITQRSLGECIFIDDRALNVECASRLGIHAIQFQGAPQLREELRTLGVDV